jgi:hypothetical protein
MVKSLRMGWRRGKPCHAAARFGRVGRDVGDAELRQRSADLGEFGFMDFAARFRRVEVVRAAIIGEVALRLVRRRRAFCRGPTVGRSGRLRFRFERRLGGASSPSGAVCLHPVRHLVAAAVDPRADDPSALSA